MKKIKFLSLLCALLFSVSQVFATTTNVSYGTDVQMTVTNLNSLANSATAGWQSARIDNIASVKALDYEISVKVDLANTAPANDKAVYVYISSAFYDGTSWFQDDGGTATLPGGSEGTYTIASPNNLKILGVLAYTTADQIVQGTFLLSNAVGQYMPDGFQIIIINYTGAAVAASANVVQYTPITETNA